jgi:hypothetical protein
MSVRPCSGFSLVGPCGVWGVARVQGLVRNRRDPSAWPASGGDRMYKPMVKSSGGQRESEGVVVPVIGVQRNTSGGKGPHFDRAGGEGKRQGMTGTARSNNPGGPQSVDPGQRSRPRVGRVRKLQRKLWAAARQSEERRFHALYDRICRGGVLWEAWRRVLRNRGAGAQPACRSGRAVERGLVHRDGLVPVTGHYPLSKDGVTHVKKIIGKPYAGKPHVRIERGMGNRARKSTAP